ncbi:nucleotidyltransferase [Geomicrobium sp. JSM 1781026]|uniref:nucleotidyltransferase n=1 Tax=Geomicrobium sp. JSM 1781026 TaxID=3344580 RepID=UPI0035C0E77F
MKAIGLVVEYNPFHNGHLYHLQKSKEDADADVVICVMSGYYLQRGEPAGFDRKTRTEMALSCGADVVVELPYTYSTQHASLFARGSISILDGLLADAFYFGSESGDIDSFLALDAFMIEHEQLLQHHLRQGLDEGYSYPRAQAYAFNLLHAPASYPDLSQPNNILGYEYVKATRELGARIQPQTITRIGSGYHSEQLDDALTIASATAIRKTLHSEGKSDVGAYMPAYCERAIQHQPLITWADYYPLLQHVLLTTAPDHLGEIYEAEEGIHHRLIAAAKQARDFQTFMETVKTKRYTWTRIQRLLVHVLTNTSKDDMRASFGESCTPRSVRLLGFTETGQSYLRSIKKTTALHLYHRPPRQKGAQERLDEKAAIAYYSHAHPDERVERYKEEYGPPVVVRHSVK